MRGVIHHLDLTVGNPEKSFTLYDAVLRSLGYELYASTERGFDWRLQTDDGHHSIGIVRAATGAKEHDRYQPGLHHVAFAVESRKAVDAFHELLVSVGATVLDAPSEYPQYNRGEGYYAVFFADPDGLKLECVFTPTSKVQAVPRVEPGVG